MKRPDQKIKRKFDSWLAMLICRSAHSQVDSDAFGQRLQSIVSPLMSSGAIQETVHNALAQVASWEDKADLKGEVLERCTHQKMAEHISLAQEMLTWRPLTQEAEKPQTIGDLIQGWAELTGQNPQDFLARIYPKVAALVQEWQSRSGALGLTDEEVFGHPQEAGELMAGLMRLLLEETPQAKLVELMVAAMSTIAETPGADLEAGLQDILGEGCAFTAWRTSRQVGAALEANPEVKAALSTPEAAALVEYEELKQGWGGDAVEAVQLLGESLDAELCQQSREATRDVLVEALKSVGRRSLLNNLREAIRGQLRGRLVEAVLDWIRKLPRIEWKVESLPDDGGIYRILIKEDEK